MTHYAKSLPSYVIDPHDDWKFILSVIPNQTEANEGNKEIDTHMNLCANDPRHVRKSE